MEYCKTSSNDSANSSFNLSAEYFITEDNDSFDPSEVGYKFNPNNDSDLFSIVIGLCTVSILVSSINLLVLTRPSLRASSLYILLIAMESANMVLAVSLLPQCAIRFNYDNYSYMTLKYVQVGTYFLDPLALAASCFTVWMTVAVSIWCCVGVLFPLGATKALTRNRAYLVTASLAVFSIVGVGALRVSTLQVSETLMIFCIDDGNQTVSAISKTFYQVDVTDIDLRVKLGQVFLVLFLVIPGVLLVFATLLLSIKISLVRHKALQRNTVKAEPSSARTTIVLTVMLVAFWLSNCTVHFNNFAHHITGSNLPHPWNFVCDYFMPGLIVNSLSFFGFYFMGTLFRETFLGFFRRKVGLPL